MDQLKCIASQNCLRNICGTHKHTHLLFICGCLKCRNQFGQSDDSRNVLFTGSVSTNQFMREIFPSQLLTYQLIKFQNMLLQVTAKTCSTNHLNLYKQYRPACQILFRMILLSVWHFGTLSIAKFIILPVYSHQKSWFSFKEYWDNKWYKNTCGWTGFIFVVKVFICNEKKGLLNIFASVGEIWTSLFLHCKVLLE